MIVEFDNALNERQCDSIIEIANRLGLEKSEVVTPDWKKKYYDEKHRKCNSVYFKKDDLYNELYERICIVHKKANESYFKLDLESLDFMVAQYEEGDVAFEWHTDDPLFSSEGIYWSGRKLTSVFQLSMSSNYSGGDLEIELARNQTKTSNRNKGNCIIFPSFLPHRVTPITSGIRYSLVVWSKGPPWK